VKTLLHVGCGRLRMANLPYFRDGGWEEIRYDIDPAVQPDIVGESQDMSLIDDGAVDALWSSHNIEHVWSFEVQPVLREFRRVLRADGYLVVLCPDMLQLAQAVAEGMLEKTLYESPAGPIRTIDILYGHQPSIQAGNLYMAHKMAFTSETLATHLHEAGFASVVVLRDKACGMHAVATASPAPREWVEETAGKTCQQPDIVFELLGYGGFSDATQSR
jgi:hypothetical protein